MLSNKPLLTFAHGQYVWNFYKTIKGDLCTRKYDRVVFTWSEERILLPDFKEEYSLALGGGETIYLVAEDCRGTLNYRCFDGVSWSEITYLEPYHRDHTGNLMLAASHGLVHLLYASRVEDANVRIHQFYQGKNWSEPKIINTVDVPCGEAAVQINDSGYLHLISQEKNKTVEKLNHYIFDSEKDRWQYYLNITETKDSGRMEPFIVPGIEDNLHLVWLKSDGFNFRVHYSRYQTGGWPVSGWTKEKIISFPNKNAYSPILLADKNRLLALWEQIDGIYVSVSRDGGKSWSKPEKEGQLKDFIRLNYQMSHQFTRESLDSVRAFSATGPELMLLTAYVYATKLLKEPGFLPANTGDSKSLLRMHSPDALLPKSMQLPKADYQLYALTATLEDVRLTSQQLADTLRRQRDEVYRTNSRLEDMFQHTAKLEWQIGLHYRIMTETQRNRDSVLLENAKQIAEQKDEFKNMERDFFQLKAELAEVKKTLQVYEQLLQDQMEKYTVKTEKPRGIIQQIRKFFEKYQYNP